ncbi:Appr-1-p processing, partial [Aphelenchoides avenae]
MPPKKRVSQGKSAQAQSKSASCRVVLVQKDITGVPVDAIVNAANPQLQRGGGVCGSIFRAAGRQLDDACAAFNGCATGDAVLTEAFNIRHVKAIVHAVGPRVVGSPTDQDRRDLASCYTRSLDVAVQHGLTSIAFPCISTAIYKFPNVEAARVALDAVKRWLQQDNNVAKLSHIVFCTFKDEDRTIYQGLLPGIFTGYADETVPFLGRGRGRSRKDDGDASDATMRDVSTLSAAGDVQTESTDMPPPTDTQLPLKRKRGRPPQTPTKGPVSKQSKASDAAASHDNAPVDAARRDDNVGASNTVYRTLNGVPEKDRTEWITERAPLFDEDEIARLCNDPLNETLTPAHVDTILQHIVLFHKRPVLIVSSAHSAAFDANLRALGFDEDMPKSERNHLAAAAIPALPDGFLFGDKSSFEVVILPVYVPGHYVLGIYDVDGANIHYYDSSPTPSDRTRDAAEIYLRETVKRLNARYRPAARVQRFKRRVDSTYAKQADGTSCGFFVCFYTEAYLSLRKTTGFFMNDAHFMDAYRRRVMSILLAVSTMTFPDYVPLSGFTAIDAAPSTHPQPSAQSARLAHVTKEAATSLITSMQFTPADTAEFPSNISPRAMFLYLRTAVSMYQLPAAVASPMLTQQKVFGKNAVRAVGLKLHKPPVEAHYVLIPFPLREGDDEFVDAIDHRDTRWVLAIHALEKNTTVIYDPTKTARLEVLAATQHDLKKLVVTLRRQLLRTTTATSCSIADARTYSTFSARDDSALGLLALAECYIAGSVKRLLFPDFAMNKFKNRVGGVFQQLHKKAEVCVKPLPGCRVVLVSQQPPVMTAVAADASAQAPRRSTRVIRRSKKDNAAIFTRSNLTLLRPMNDTNCGAHRDLGLGCAAQTVNHKVPVYTCGEFDQRCPHCDALLLASEVPRDGNQYTKCCAGGKVDTEYMREKYASLQDMPEPLRRYAEHIPTDPEAKNFHQNSKFYNSNMAFGSVTSSRLDPRDIPGRGVPPCRINGEMTHRLCDMYPNPERHEYEMWAQHFILDPADSLPKRLEHLRRQRNNPDYPSGGVIKPEIVDRLDRMLRDEHPFAAAYKKAHEVYEEAKQRAEREGKELPHFRLILLGNRDEAIDEDALMDDQGGRIHIHRVPEPREQNIAAIWVSDEGEPPRYYGAWLSGRKKGEFRKLDTLDPNLDPSLYPLLFPRGQQGYKLRIPLKDAAFTEQDQAEDDDDGVVDGDMQGEPGSNSRNYVSGRQHDRYIYAHRGSDVKEPHWLHSKGRLAEFYTIDAANRRERHEFDMAQHFQEDRRLISAKEFVQAMENMLQRVHPGAKLGKMMHCKPTVKGSRAYMQRAFANAMTIFDRKGKPALFVTFTGNPQWPEIQALLNTSTDTWLNHPQEV